MNFKQIQKKLKNKGCSRLFHTIAFKILILTNLRIISEEYKFVHKAHQ